MVTLLHGRLYAAEHGMDQTMEAYVARGLGEFAAARAHDEAAGRLWVVEAGGRVVGSIGVTDAGNSRAQLRWFLLDPAQRGRGLGARLMATALAYGRDRGFTGLFLWTIAGLDPAHQLYRAAGFTLTESRPVHQWGRDVLEQRFDLLLDVAATAGTRCEPAAR